MPIVAMLETRDHHGAVADLPTELVAELGAQLQRVDRAVRSLEHVGNVMIGRFGDGSEHLHWWFFARPERFEQVRTNFITIWDDVLPPVPEEIWREDVERLRATLAD